MCIAPMSVRGMSTRECHDPEYRRAHPAQCAKFSFIQSPTGAFTIAGVGVAATGILAAAATAFGNGGGGGGGAPIPTMADYDYVGDDVTSAKLTAVTASDTYIRNAAAFDSIRLAYSLARGFTGDGYSIGVLDSDSWHGAAVSQIAGGAIAPGATVIRHTVADQENNFMPYHQIAEVIATTRTDVINASWNTDAAASLVKSRTQMAAMTDAAFLDAVAGAAKDGVIFVWAAGNDASPQSGTLSALPRVIPELAGHFINVVAWDESTGKLAQYSNACGVTMNYCITAPGTGIDTGERIASGTSFAAPIVSAAVTVLKEAFPYMTAEQITDLLFTTARDLGAPGVDAVYGHGMLDMERATRPVGANLVPLADGGTTQLATARTSYILAKSIRTANPELAFIDDYGRAFETRLVDHIRIKNPGRAMGRLRNNSKQSAAVRNIEFGFRTNDMLSGSGLLGTGDTTRMAFVSYRATAYLDSMDLYLCPEIGTMRPRGRTDSVINDFSPIYTTGISGGLHMNNWRVEITVPDIILSGNMYLRMPVGRSASGDLLFSDYRIDLDGRPAVEYAVSYKIITAGFVDYPIGTDEIFFTLRHRIAF